MLNFVNYRRRRRSLKFKLFLVIVLLLAAGWGYYSYVVAAPKSHLTTPQTFNVPAGWGSTKISFELKNAGLIRNAYVFQLYIWLRGIDSKMQIGQYQLSPSLSIKDIAQILSRGTGSANEVSLTFIEGWTLRDFAQYLSDKHIASQQDFFDTVQKKVSWWDNYSILASKPRILDLEGYLFPDTYRVYKDASLPEIVQKMLDNLETKITSQLRSDITKQGRTIHEIFTMASILEKEVKTDVDRKLVADIFYRRLKAGVALQSDATVNYATGKSTARASAQDLQIDSLYNTYKYRGLPPGPIASAGLAAITAAVYPTPNQYFYFLTTPDGKVIYSKTFAEHVAAKNKYYR